jgi:TRAP-type C4-dicarboxylate transport system substrate-binding protein
MMQSARTAGVALRDEIRKSEASAIPLMQQFGLNVVHADPKAVAEWRQLAESIWPKLRGGAVPPDLFDEVKRLRDDYRKTHHAAVAHALVRAASSLVTTPGT